MARLSVGLTGIGWRQCCQEFCDWRERCRRRQLPPRPAAPVEPPAGGTGSAASHSLLVACTSQGVKATCHTVVP